MGTGAGPPTAQPDEQLRRRTVPAAARHAECPVRPGHPGFERHRDRDQESDHRSGRPPGRFTAGHRHAAERQRRLDRCGQPQRRAAGRPDRGHPVGHHRQPRLESGCAQRSAQSGPGHVCRARTPPVTSASARNDQTTRPRPRWPPSGPGVSQQQHRRGRARSGVQRQRVARGPFQRVRGLSVLAGRRSGNPVRPDSPRAAGAECAPGFTAAGSRAAPRRRG